MCVCINRYIDFKNFGFHDSLTKICFLGIEEELLLQYKKIH